MKYIKYKIYIGEQGRYGERGKAGAVGRARREPAGSQAGGVRYQVPDPDPDMNTIMNIIICDCWGNFMLTSIILLPFFNSLQYMQGWRASCGDG